ncbi:PIN domain-containing protein [Luteolibacter arcticus]|uniref:Ribonuclease VapC n=1 Tax=Luteolibacter arcticus TaxID=1581411 RepID=A0ABT3GP72_9BACT|nr:PIN domain-containing protein [Luteolibacter arcticus]MCW1925263.1 PIN domain-containing protein [Luteolibacter arcticus]
MRRYLADTNVLSEVLKKRPNSAVVNRLRTLSPASIFASEITRMELRFGAALHPQAETLWESIETSILPLATWLEFDREASTSTADLLAEMRKAGTPIGPWDTCLAGTALARGLVVVTRNVAHFNRIPKLRVENWFEE